MDFCRSHVSSLEIKLVISAVYYEELLLRSHFYEKLMLTERKHKQGEYNISL